MERSHSLASLGNQWRRETRRRKRHRTAPDAIACSERAILDIPWLYSNREFRNHQTVKIRYPLLALLLTSLGCGGSGKSETGGKEGDAGTTDAGTTIVPAPGGLFEVPEPWTKDVSALSKSPRSDAILSALDSLGGWGGGGSLRIDFSIPVLFADSATPRQTISANGPDYCFDGPDCEAVPMQMPIPSNGNTEGSSDYRCDTTGDTDGQGDCHVLVVELEEKKLYELYNATQSANGFTALGVFVWDLSRAYGDDLRGEQCTSADAAGFPIAGLLPTADETASGSIDHALRFILPNAVMKKGVYVPPASHAGAPKSNNPDAPPYGVRFRLKASFDDSGYSDGEKVILHALKTHGMLLSDGGQIALTFADDRYSTVKWASLGVDANSFGDIEIDDFEVVDLGDEVPLTYDCVRNR